MSELTVEQAIQIALAHQKAGELAEAEEIFRQILDAYPEQADALHLLGGVYLQADRPDVAEQRVRHAILLRPAEPAFKLTLGLALQRLQRFEEALELYQELLRDNPDFTEAYVHLGVTLSHRGRFEEAARAFQEAIYRAPMHLDAQGNLGIVLCHLKRWDEAILALRAALSMRPNSADYHAGMGAALYFTGHLEAALVSCQKAVELEPNQGQAWHVLAITLRDLGRAPESLDAARKAAELLPGISDIQVTYGEGLRASGRLDDAIAHYRRCIDLFPDVALFHNNLGNVCKDSGRLDEAIAEYRQTLELQMDPALFSNLLYTMHYAPSCTPAMIAQELQRYDKHFGKPLAKSIRPHANTRDPARPPPRLRVGYMSNEFRQHALTLNLLPLFAQHDKTQFEIYCYADVPRPDFYTHRMRQCADHWHDIHGLSDDAIAELIRSHQIDILFDLHQHMAGNRLPIYARKPAPVQIAFAGFPGSTGLSAMDYRLTDPFLEPDGKPLEWSSEKVLWLPATWWCYHPAIEISVNPLPALLNGYITFGNLNNFCKLNDQVYACWAKVMNAVEGSHLTLLASEGSHRDHTRAFFEKQGITPDRILFVTRQPSAEYYRLYHHIDLSLDSFPCNGHTTSMDSFFMGVPVTSTIGEGLFGRATWSQLNNLHLPELAGKTEEEFVKISIKLAKDLPRLAELRKTLRDRMKKSPLMDNPAFAKGIEAAYREGWKRWCAQRH